MNLIPKMYCMEKLQILRLAKDHIYSIISVFID